MKPEIAQGGSDYVDLSHVTYLVADKSHFTRDLLHRTLRNFSATDIRTASGFGTALDMIAERPPEIIFTSLSADQAAARDFLKTLRRTASNASSHIPVIAISQSACAEEVAIALGAESCITVPFSVAMVETHLIRALEGVRHRRMHC